MMVDRLWGKGGEPGEAHALPCHMLDVAAVMEAAFQTAPGLLEDLAALLGLPAEAARRLLLTLAALHDLGKVATAFQRLRPDLAATEGRGVTRYDFRQAGHDRIGYALMRDLWRGGRGLVTTAPELPLTAPWPIMAPLMAAAAGHHRGQPSSASLREFAPWLREEVDRPAAAELMARLGEMFAWSGPVPTAEAARRASYVVNGLITVCDWLGSDQAFAFHAEVPDLDHYFHHVALPTARQVLLDRGIHKLRAQPLAPVCDFAALFQHLGTMVPTPLQQACADLFDAGMPGLEMAACGPLLVLLEDAPGAGKTEAGDLVIHRLMAAGRASGFYCGLPTTATADAAYDRKRPLLDRLFAEPCSFMLGHARREMSGHFRTVETRAELERGDGEALAWFAQGSRRALLAEAGVGTIDQALMGALRLRHGPVRLFGLWRKVLLVDEVHAYDDYMLETLEALLRHHAAMGDHAVLMSATLPSALRGRLVAAFAAGAGWGDGAERMARLDRRSFPLLGLHGASGGIEHPVPLRAPPRPVHLEPVHTVEEAMARVVTWAARGDCVVWFRNTVVDALESWDRLAEELATLGLAPPTLFHARFLPEHRAALETAIVNDFGKTSGPDQRRGRVVIATQVAEQSLDLDFDHAVIDLAPPDVVLQRLGRRRRHTRAADGTPTPDLSDGRAPAPALLLMPPLDAAKDAGARGWLARLLPRAAGLYPDDARLWLGAQHLTDPRTIPDRRAEGEALVPELDARPLLESVHGEDLQSRTPPALWARHDRTDGAAVAERQEARRVTLGFRAGLLQDWADGAIAGVGDDDHPPTRLGESYSLVLARRDPLGLLGERLERSAVTVPWPVTTLAEDMPVLPALAATLPPSARRRLPDMAVVLLDAAGSGWGGSILLGSRLASVTYDALRGLKIV